MKNYKINYKTGRIDFQGMWIPPNYVNMIKLDYRRYFA